ncbi:MAG: hypothetical protein QOH39_3506 [Verrucomicrobiota bacterium]|jgi:hypothetical protein
MKKYKFSRTLHVWIALFAFFIGCGTNQAMIANSPARGPSATKTFAADLKEGGRLVIWRAPNLGNNLFVNLRIDGRGFTSIGYGHNYETILPPGRHVLTITGTPRMRYHQDAWVMTLDVQAGQTYSFTAVLEADQQVVLRRSPRGATNSGGRGR